MIIDVHGHMSAPDKLWAYKATLLAARGAHGRGRLLFSDDQIREAMHDRGPFLDGHLQMLDKHKTDLQLVSPRPFQMMHSEKPGVLVHWFTEECNNLIYRQMQLYADRFIGIAGLPQVAGQPIKEVLPELERCVKELGFVGCLFNSDPYENSGVEAPGLGDRYWYPLWEKLCDLDVPAMLHGTGSRSPRVSYSTHFINEETVGIVNLLHSKVFDDFPTLKIIIPHGGGAIPYQIGRYDAPELRGESTHGGKRAVFSERMRNHLYFDTVLYTPGALRLLIETVGAERCLFGSECPGVGSAINPKTGRSMDDVASHLQALDGLSEPDKKLIFEDNARRLFKLDGRLNRARLSMHMAS
jgi:predicted TIM-barrel fold metal-dependent hydrolase